MPSLLILQTALCCITAILVGYFDIRYRRIPNKLVLPLLLSGLLLGLVFAGTAGLIASLQGLLLGFGLMFLLHLFGALGAGDVKLFAALGAVLGVQLVLPTFVIAVLTGGVLAVASMLYAGTARVTSERVLLILGGLVMGSVPRFPVPDDKRQTLPYGVAITVGSLLSLLWHNVSMN
ncbi:MAG: prepilin peptidase [Acidobacteria bacterium]|nr:prepilin peptidase [Acidobacteriota bacterium]MBI3426331.1 prepilin peptidase [Acidobacteriota bacterium]